MCKKISQKYQKSTGEKQVKMYNKNLSEEKKNQLVIR